MVVTGGSDPGAAPEDTSEGPRSPWAPQPAPGQAGVSQPGAPQSGASPLPPPQPGVSQPGPRHRPDPRFGPPGFGPPGPGTVWRADGPPTRQYAPYGPPPPYGPPSPAAAPRRSTGGMLAVAAVIALVAALIGGGVGGIVGVSLSRGDTGSAGVLGRPLPPLDPSDTPLGPVEAVADRVLPSVVQLRVAGPAEQGEGSGMVLSSDGLLLTNNHVVEGAANGGSVVAVFQDGRTAAVQIVGRDPASDIAVIRAQGVSGLTPVELGNSDAVRVGQQVVAFGSPLGLGGTVTTGIISARHRAVNVGPESGAAAATVLDALQTDAAINPGNSGGPLVDMQGRVVGINSAIATTGAQGGSIGVGFSIPINQAQRVAGELERTGKASHAVLGVSVADDPTRAGALIGTVTPGGAAELAGIRQGDLVVRFGDQQISTGTDLQAAVGSRAPGEVVAIQLTDRTVQATLTEAPG
jgi:putative serine protease PepD